MKSGDRLDIQCTYNNTPSNPKLADSLSDRGLQAPIDVRLGESTLDEMCLTATSFIYKAR